MVCSELEIRKAGGKGRFIRDDPRKYPGKEDLGVFCEPFHSAAAVI